MRIRLPCVCDYSKKHVKVLVNNPMPNPRHSLKPAEGNKEERQTPEIRTSESSMCHLRISLDNTYVTSRSPPLAHCTLAEFERQVSRILTELHLAPRGTRCSPRQIFSILSHENPSLHIAWPVGVHTKAYRSNTMALHDCFVVFSPLISVPN